MPTTIVAGLAFFVYGLAPSFGWFVLASVIWGVASSMAGAAPAAYAADVAPQTHAATGMSTYRTLSDVGYVVGPIALGLVADTAGLEAAVFTASGLLIGVAVLFTFGAPETHAGRKHRSVD